jgi:hypothetical protein
MDTSGHTIWRADFRRGELAVPDGSLVDNFNDPQGTGIVTEIVA